MKLKTPQLHNYLEENKNIFIRYFKGTINDYTVLNESISDIDEIDNNKDMSKLI